MLPITPACSRITSAAAAPAKASVRGAKAAKNSATLVRRSSDRPGLRL
jgi:hypothetical protein